MVYGGCRSRSRELATRRRQAKKAQSLLTGPCKFQERIPEKPKLCGGCNVLAQVPTRVTRLRLVKPSTMSLSCALGLYPFEHGCFGHPRRSSPSTGRNYTFADRRANAVSGLARKDNCQGMNVCDGSGICPQLRDPRSDARLGSYASRDSPFIHLAPFAEPQGSRDRTGAAVASIETVR